MRCSVACSWPSGGRPRGSGALVVFSDGLVRVHDLGRGPVQPGPQRPALERQRSTSTAVHVSRVLRVRYAPPTPTVSTRLRPQRDPQHAWSERCSQASVGVGEGHAYRPRGCRFDDSSRSPQPTVEAGLGCSRRPERGAVPGRGQVLTAPGDLSIAVAFLGHSKGGTPARAAGRAACVVRVRGARGGATSEMVFVESVELFVMNRSVPAATAVARWTASAARSRWVAPSAVASSAMVGSTGRRSIRPSWAVKASSSVSTPSRMGLVSSSGSRSTEPMPALAPPVVACTGKSARTRRPRR
jgi:hypothetical protein